MCLFGAVAFALHEGVVVAGFEVKSRSATRGLLTATCEKLPLVTPLYPMIVWCAFMGWLCGRGLLAGRGVYMGFVCARTGLSFFLRRSVVRAHGCF